MALRLRREASWRAVLDFLSFLLPSVVVAELKSDARFFEIVALASTLSRPKRFRVGSFSSHNRLLAVSPNQAHDSALAEGESRVLCFCARIGRDARAE